MRYVTGILIWGLFIISAFFIPGHSSVQAQTTKDMQENYTFLLKNPNQTYKFLKKLDINNKNVKVTVIEEIGLVYIENYGGDEGLEQELSLHSEKLAKYISAEGELPELQVPLDKPSVTDFKDTKGKEIQKLQTPSLSSPDFKPYNWYLEAITENYQSQTINKGDNTSIALIDSGIDRDHPLLTHNINLDLGKNYTSDELNVNDEMGHGTSVAGILTSIAPNTSIVPYKVFGVENGKSLWVLEAIVDSTNDDNDILNLSLGTYKSKNDKEEQLLIKAYDAAIKYANKNGVLVIAAAGNFSEDLDTAKRNDKMYLPGNLKDVITVSSSTINDTLASYSNYGRNIDFSAPGGDIDATFNVNGLILTTFPINKPNNFIDQAMGIPSGYTLSNGTSLSAPQVSASIALIISEYKEIKGKKPNMNKVMKYLKEGASDLGNPGYDVYFGYGKINAYQSLISMQQ
ncbi:S8 family serine peptidase [Priestia filamentosa]|uniref:S8 family peptidase n=1 Tax=Priestia filamentosa TaxID=1402861 RepID=UPI00397C4574